MVVALQPTAKITLEVLVVNVLLVLLAMVLSVDVGYFVI